MGFGVTPHVGVWIETLLWQKPLLRFGDELKILNISKKKDRVLVLPKG